MYMLIVFVIPRHVGDMGNATAGADGVAKVDLTDKLLSLTGQHSIVGRTVVVSRSAIRNIFYSAVIAETSVEVEVGVDSVVEVGWRLGWLLFTTAIVYQNIFQRQI